MKKLKDLWNNTNKIAIYWVLFSFVWGISSHLLDNSTTQNPWWAFVGGFLMFGTLISLMIVFLGQMIATILFPRESTIKDCINPFYITNKYGDIFIIIFSIVVFISMNIFWFYTINTIK